MELQHILLPAPGWGEQGVRTPEGCGGLCLCGAAAHRGPHACRLSSWPR